MLTKTLCHIPRVSLAKERTLWEQGIQCWTSYRSYGKNSEFLDDCEQHLLQGNPQFFAAKLKPDQHWRLFSDFKDSIAYIDIETTGLDRSRDHITTIALYDGKTIRTYVHGKNLDDFPRDLAPYKLMVSFNGKTFDIPFIQSYFGIELNKAHIDLRYVLKRLGYSGGLKEVERRLGIDRGDLKDVDGFFAVTLWHLYKNKKNQAALETLLAYNCADVVNLELLMTLAYNLNLKETPFAAEKNVESPIQFKIPYRADPALVRRAGF